MVGGGGVGAHQHGHQVGAGGVGDPGLVAGDDVGVAVAGGAGAQAAEVGAGVGLGEDRGRQHLGRGDPRQPVRLLRLGAAAEDQLGGDLGAGAERADADIAAARAPRRRRTSRSWTGRSRRIPRGWSGRTRRARPSPRRSRSGSARPSRCQPWAMRHDPLVGEAAELVADHLVVVVEAGGAEAGGARRRRSISVDQPARGRRRCCRRRSAPRPRGCGSAATRLGAEADVGRADDLDLRHRDAAGELGEVLAEADLQDQPLDLAEAPGGVEAAGPAGELAQALGIRSPSRRGRGRRTGRPRAPRSRRGRAVLTRAASALARGGDERRGGLGGGGAAAAGARAGAASRARGRGRLRSSRAPHGRRCVRRGIVAAVAFKPRGKSGERQIRRARLLPPAARRRTTFLALPAPGFPAKNGAGGGENMAGLEGFVAEYGVGAAVGGDGGAGARAASPRASSASRCR